jgi:hypothetical protein
MSAVAKVSWQKTIAEGTDWRFFERAQMRAEGVNVNWEELRCPSYRTGGSF